MKHLVAKITNHPLRFIPITQTVCSVSSSSSVLRLCSSAPVTAMASSDSSTVSPAPPLTSPGRASSEVAPSGSLRFDLSLIWVSNLTKVWTCLLLGCCVWRPQVVGEMQSSLERVRRQLSSTSTRQLLQGPLLKRSDTVIDFRCPPSSFPLFWTNNCCSQLSSFLFV